MLNTFKIYDELTTTMDVAAARKITEVITLVYEDLQNTATKQEVQDLRDVVSELAQAQKRTEERLDALTFQVQELAQAQKRTEERVEELAQAQKRTEERVEELAQAQKRTEERVEELAQAQKRTEETVRMLVQEVEKLSRGLDNTRSQIGGLARSVSYALENEAYRKLPAYLQARHQLILQERLIRTEIGGQEINLFASAARNGEAVIVVGESVLRLDDPSKLGHLQAQVDLVHELYHLPVIPLIVTHYARPALREQAEQAGIIVVQSFEWDV
ncbi:hypothetical protein U27_02212 [Candidatus Vecturithrix granuli]|uniref:Chromosome partition protein Smc n=1 Tax=Vecturithrix granuli TaxID=1499967 RepID=A0A0S6WB58_VECG1|nr:hypothetical protein U27_02212 [Candidatus Vecturithrix granuli]